mmetsp:Transcript_22440/g.37409  ORF Transcript_22440/g.37409 Transcript_22440/m.37409 type:complete len:330 (-) Transcript_22440:208-1197(-)
MQVSRALKAPWIGIQRKILQANLLMLSQPKVGMRRWCGCSNQLHSSHDGPGCSIKRCFTSSSGPDSSSGKSNARFKCPRCQSFLTSTNQDYANMYCPVCSGWYLIKNVTPHGSSLGPVDKLAPAPRDVIAEAVAAAAVPQEGGGTGGAGSANGQGGGLSQAVPTPREIYEGLAEHVIGQHAVKVALAVGVHNHYKRCALAAPPAAAAAAVVGAPELGAEALGQLGQQVQEQVQPLRPRPRLPRVGGGGGHLLAGPQHFLLPRRVRGVLAMFFLIKKMGKYRHEFFANKLYNSKRCQCLRRYILLKYSTVLIQLDSRIHLLACEFKGICI